MSIAIVQARNQVILISSYRSGEKLLDHKYILNIQPVRFAIRGNVKQRKKESKMIPKVIVFSISVNGALNEGDVGKQ